MLVAVSFKKKVFIFLSFLPPQSSFDFSFRVANKRSVRGSRLLASLCKSLLLLQEEIREVFEGSCKLIPIALIKKECIRVADEFIPELIDTLASEMNPQVVCATAGLCNSPTVDRLIRQYKVINGSYESSN